MQRWKPVSRLAVTSSVNIFGALSGELLAPSGQGPARAEGPSDHFAFQSSQLTSSQLSMRISAISYLNTAPLMWDFEHGEAGKQFQISYTIPSTCARDLESGAADIGIIPAAAYALMPGLKILPDVAIASRRPVRSILLVSKVPIEDVRTVAVETSSMTSVALLKVLFEKWLGAGTSYNTMPTE